MLKPEDELEARKQDSVFDGSDPSELVPSEEDEEWPEEEESWNGTSMSNEALERLKEIEWGE